MEAWREAVAERTKHGLQALARQIEHNIFNDIPRWPGMTREDWWLYYKQMTEACDDCRYAPFTGGPSEHWTHAEHQDRMGYRVHD